jgi:glyoxylase-like metal-dependent hydrolase (beta-lactamase superfamily II)
MNPSLRPPLPSLLALLLAPALAACSITSHAAKPAALGVPRSSDDLARVVDLPGPVTVETVDSADWAVPLSGLVNLKAPAARAAGLVERDEPIHVSFHALRHPTRGLYIIDTGAERALRDDPERAAIRGFVYRVMNFKTLRVRTALGDWLAAHPAEPLRGVLMTHLHPDHVSGMADVPRPTPVYAGPGDAAASDVLYWFLQPNTDRALEGLPAIEEWAFAADGAGRFSGVIDVFGDETVWALHCPGHTPGSTAYLVRTPQGPVLFTGDTSHTRWGWEHDVEPGDLTSDHAGNLQSLARLRAFAAAHPAMQVRVGHQE